MKVKRIFRLFLLALLLLFSVEAAQAEDGRTVRPKNKPKAETNTAATTESSGHYYALVIGNNNYKHLPKLKTAVNDAEDVEKLLKGKYGFQTKLLLNATRTDILGSVNELRKKLGGKDNLLIYYAGHGEFDKAVDKAYWLPVDAQRDDPTNWIIADDITSNIKRLASKHILIVSDSCYSGTLSRAAVIDMREGGDRNEYLRKMTDRPSRTLMASGGNEPVADGGGGKNSVFASAFLRAMEEADKRVFTAEELFHGRVKSIVAGKSEQVPEYAEIRNSGHSGGDFVFLAKGSVTVEEPIIQEQPSTPQPEETTTGRLTIKTTAAGAQVYIDGNNAGTAPVTKTLSPGNYNIELRKEGYKAATETVRVEKGKEKTVSLLMEKSTGSIRVSSNPAGGKVYIDGAYTDTAPNTITDLKAGTYKIKVTKEGYSEWTGNVSVGEGEEAEITATLKEAKKPQRVSASSTAGTITDATTWMEFVFVKGGCYQMGDAFGDGDADEKPVHEVCVDDFYIGKYEVTQGQWQAVMGSNPSHFKDCGSNCPVENVSWNDTQEFISKLNSRSGVSKYRLPSEAEWEYAARSGGKSEKYAGGSDIGSVAWYRANSGSKTHPVGEKQPNGLGIYDMSGNVWEWVQDWYGADYYKSSPRDNPKGPGSEQYKMFRGGSWYDVPVYARAATRLRNRPAVRDDNDGFRLAAPAQ